TRDRPRRGMESGPHSRKFSGWREGARSHRVRRCSDNFRHRRLAGRLDTRNTRKPGQSGGGAAMQCTMRKATLATVLWVSLAGAAAPQERIEAAIPNARLLAPAEKTRVIEKARDNALQYLRNLPNFICIETIRRYERGKPAQSWKAFDTLVLDLSYSGQGE